MSTYYHPIRHWVHIERAKDEAGEIYYLIYDIDRTPGERVLVGVIYDLKTLGIFFDHTADVAMRHAGKSGPSVSALAPGIPGSTLVIDEYHTEMMTLAQCLAQYSNTKT